MDFFYFFYFDKDGVLSSLAVAATFILLTFWMLLSSCVGNWLLCFWEGRSLTILFSFSVVCNVSFPTLTLIVMTSNLRRNTDVMKKILFFSPP